MPLAVRLFFAAYGTLWGAAIPLLRANRRLAIGYGQRTLRSFPDIQADLWIHAASVGEAILALRLAGMAVDTLKGLAVLITTTTGQGLATLDSTLSGPEYDGKKIATAFIPFDRPALMERALDLVRPRVVALVETELWPGLLVACKNRGLSVVVVNGRLTAKSLRRYLWWPKLWQTIAPERILAMSAADAKRFAALFPCSRVERMKNMKFDTPAFGDGGVGAEGRNPLSKLLPARIPVTDHGIIHPELANLPSDKRLQGAGDARHRSAICAGVQSLADNPADSVPCDRLPVPFLVLGSVRREEEKAVAAALAVIREKRPQAIIGLFPRHMQRVDAWKKRLASMGSKWTLRSRTTQQVAPGTVILWDTTGELSQAYGLALGAFVGGSLAPLGGQNFLEPLAMGVVPVVGPWWDNFSWVGEEIVSQGLLSTVRTPEELAATLIHILDQPADRNEIKTKIKNYAKKKTGGTETALAAVLHALAENDTEDENHGQHT